MPERTVEIPEEAIDAVRNFHWEGMPLERELIEEALMAAVPILTAPLLRELEAERNVSSVHKRAAGLYREGKWKIEARADQLQQQLAESAETYTREEVERRLTAPEVIEAVARIPWDNEFPGAWDEGRDPESDEDRDPRPAGRREVHSCAEALLDAAFPESQPTQDQKDGDS